MSMRPCPGLIRLAAFAAAFSLGLTAPAALAQAPQGHPFARVSLHDWENRTEPCEVWNAAALAERPEDVAAFRVQAQGQLR